MDTHSNPSASLSQRALSAGKAFLRGALIGIPLAGLLYCIFGGLSAFGWLDSNITGFSNFFTLLQFNMAFGGASAALQEVFSNTHARPTEKALSPSRAHALTSEKAADERNIDAPSVPMRDAQPSCTIETRSGHCDHQGTTQHPVPHTHTLH